WGSSGHDVLHRKCLLLTQSGHRCAIIEAKFTRYRPQGSVRLLQSGILIRIQANISRSKKWEICVGRSNRRQEKPMKEIMVGVVLMVATATPGFAQAYCACWGTGNVIDQPLLE